MNNLDTFAPNSLSEWREWLAENHKEKSSIWLIQYKIKSEKTTISWSDAVDQALCYGWIDSVRRPIDEESFMHYYSKRKPKSDWSKVNKEKVERLIADGLMTPAGQECIDIAKQNGAWDSLNEVEELIIPADLELEFKSNPKAKEYFLSLSKTVRKMMLYWVSQAKKAETRQKRINEIIEKTGKGEKPNGY
jgi:uncharacterized protein YdeI (YjbR/CyaY-like superfamily)